MLSIRDNPAEAQAFQVVPGISLATDDTWIGEAFRSGVIRTCVGGYAIHTSDGPMIADYGDWIIRGVKGELYSSKPPGR